PQPFGRMMAIDGTTRELDAKYAELQDANARVHALQQRLRAAQPLLWLDGALVMNKPTKPTRRRPRTSSSSPLTTDVDLAMMDMLSGPSRRNIEWEVSKRIARVDRELRVFPPSQRSWNRRDALRRQAAAAVSAASNQAEEPRATSKRQTAASGRKKSPLKAPVDADKERDDRRSVRAPLPSSPALAATRKPMTKPPIRPLAAARAPSIDLNWSDDEKENEKVNKTIKPVEQPIFVKPASSVDMDASQPVDEEKSSDDQTEDRPLKSQATEEPPEPALKPKAMDRLNHDIGLENDTAVVANAAPRQPHDLNKPRELAVPSSIGHQILSDNRTMPSVSFGAPAAVGDQAKRLNSDVLRRLFNDLDTDKDGRLNRIEVCMAMHRLQLSVSAARIASFFRRVHEAVARDDVGNGFRLSPREPLREVIDYKQFIAFVTAAFDRQQQQPQPKSQIVRARPAPSKPPSSPPVPTKADHIASSSPLDYRIAATSGSLETRQTNSMTTKLVYVVENDDVSIETKIMRDLPDLLVACALTEGEESTVNGEAQNPDGKTSVASSIDEATLKGIIKNLMQEYIQQNAALRDSNDASGLRRAGAFFNQHCSSTFDTQPDASVEGSDNGSATAWVDVLTEEQVAALVKHITRTLKSPTPPDQDPIVTEEAVDDPVEDIVDESPTAVMTTPDSGREQLEQATDMPDFEAVRRIGMVAEKAVQAGEDDVELQLAKDHRDTSPSNIFPVEEVQPQPVADASPQLRSHLAAAIVGLSRAVMPVNPRSRSGTDRSREVLQALRRQRQSTVQLHASTTSSVSMASSSVCSIRSSISTSIGDKWQSNASSDQDPQRLHKSKKGDGGQATQWPPLSQTVEQSTPVAPLPLIEKTLGATSMASIESWGGSSYSSNSSGSVAMNSVSESWRDRSIFAASPWQPTGLRHRRHHRVVSDEDPGSNSSEDLSEGEIKPRLARRLDLSDGELFGKQRDKVVRQRNRATAAQHFAQGPLSSQHDALVTSRDSQTSVESGEVPRILEERYHAKLLDVSSSSLESGEAEEGAILDEPTVATS
ncbi:TPA: hypothetical protein N0F65_002186, partial [Lagenidium giganteum]